MCHISLMDECVERMKPYLDQPGFISPRKGANIVKKAYVEGHRMFQPRHLSDFGNACFLGQEEKVKDMYERGRAPDLSSTEMPFLYGYATLIVRGAQTISPAATKETPKHYETLKYLISKGLPVDVPDIVGFTALQFAVQWKPHSTSGSIVKLLLKSGADVNHQNRYGETALWLTLPSPNTEEHTVDHLMEFGANVDLANGQGDTPRRWYMMAGAEKAAIIEKWLKRRNGEEKRPMDRKSCGACGSKKNLNICSKCKVVYYCSEECHSSHWPTHKAICKAFSPDTTVNVVPKYDPDWDRLVPMVAFTRDHLGAPVGPINPAHTVRSNLSEDLYGKPIIIKIQVRLGTEDDDLLVYTKKRDFVCTIAKQDGPQAYDRIVKAVRKKGMAGAKAYFTAVLNGKDELVVKVADVLAPQPF